MNVSEKKNTPEASDRLIDSLLKNVAANPEGAKDEEFLAKVEMAMTTATPDKLDKKETITIPLPDSRQIKTKWPRIAWATGIAAIFLVTGAYLTHQFIMHQAAPESFASVEMETGKPHADEPDQNSSIVIGSPDSLSKLEPPSTPLASNEKSNPAAQNPGYVVIGHGGIRENLTVQNPKSDNKDSSAYAGDVVVIHGSSGANRKQRTEAEVAGSPPNKNGKLLSYAGNVSNGPSEITISMNAVSPSEEGKKGTAAPLDALIKVAESGGGTGSKISDESVHPAKKSRTDPQIAAAPPMVAKPGNTYFLQAGNHNESDNYGLGGDAKIGSGSTDNRVLFGRDHVNATRGKHRGNTRFRTPQPSSVNAETQYSPLIDNTWTSPYKEPLSTFSIDVDTASWTNIRGMLESGTPIGNIPADSVRVEEMINYFDWNYPQPDDEHPFGFAVESANCPWNDDTKLMRVAIQGKDIQRDKRPAANLVFLLDVSGSMNKPNKLELAKKAISTLTEELDSRDCVSIVVYAGAEGVALHPTKGNEQAEILDALNRLKAGGSTNGGAGINLAYKIAGENFIKGATNRVILCTDGDFNVGLTGTETLTQLVERKAKQDRVFLSVCGFGNDNLNDAMLESITNKGNGTYYFIDTFAEARKVFLKDMMATLVTIAKDVKIQVEFNPGQVKAYRLIGYANRKLAAEDFADDTVDAGEIGAGHTVTAFYEIVPAGSDLDPGKEITTNLRYQKEVQPEPAPQPKREIVDSPELALLKLRYKAPDGDVSKLIEHPVMPQKRDWRKASADFKFASAVAAFGMKLRNHQSVRGVELQEIINLAESGIKNDHHGYRAEFVRILKKQSE